MVERPEIATGTRFFRRLAREPLLPFVIAGAGFEVLGRERADARMLLGFLFLIVALAGVRQLLTGRAFRGSRPEHAAGALTERATTRLLLQAAALGLAPSLLTAVLFGITRGDWPLALLAGLTLAIALLPEELPLIWDLCLALGAAHLARTQVLQRRAAVEETLHVFKVLTESGQEGALLGDRVEDLPHLEAARAVARQTIDNFRAAIAFVLGVHVPMVGLAILPVLLGWKLVLMPAHVLLLELVVIPACALVFAAERGAVDTRPRVGSERGVLYERATLTLGLLRGGVIFAMVVLAHEIAMLGRAGEHLARATTVIALIAAAVGLTHARRTSANPWLWPVTVFISMLLTALLYVPVLRERFAFGVPPPSPLPVTLGLGAGLLAAGLLDAVARRRGGRPERPVTRV